MPSNSRFFENPLFLSLVILIIAAGLRFYHLSALSLWSDELFSLATISQIGIGTPWYAYIPKTITQLTLEDSFLTWKAAEHSPPLFEILLWLWTSLFGTSDFAVRSLSAVLGCFAPIIIFLGLKRPLGIFSAFLSALILAVMPTAVMYSQEARNYSLLITLSTVATVRLVQYIYEKHDSNYRSESSWWSHYSLDIIIYTLMSYAHYTGLILSLAYIVVRVVSAFIGKRKDYYLLMFFLVPMLLLPWIYLNWHTLAITNNGSMGWRDYTIQDIWQMMIPAVATFFIPGKYSLLLFSAAILATGYLSIYSLNNRHNSFMLWIKDIRTLLGLAFVATLTLQFAHSIYTAFHARVWHWRYFSVSLPMCAVFFALFISQSEKFKLWISSLTFVLIYICALNLMEHYQTDNKEDYRGATQYIVDRSHDDSLVVGTWKPNAAFYLHYLKKLMLEKNKHFSFQGFNSNDDLIGICSSTPAVESRQVFVLGHYSHKELGEVLKSMCADRLKFRSEKDFYGMFVMEFEILAK